MVDTYWKRMGSLLVAATLALAGCSGEQGDTGVTGPQGDQGPAGPKGDQGDPGADYVPPTPNGPGLVVAVTGATVNATSNAVSVTYTVKDSTGVALAGITPSFALAQIVKDTNGKVLPYAVATKAQTIYLAPTDPAPTDASAFTNVNPTAVKPSSTAAATGGVLVDNGGGSFTYTFPAGGITSAPGAGSHTGQTAYTYAPAVTVDHASTSTYTIWIQASRQEDLTDRRTITPVNVQYNFVPSTGAASTEKREIVSAAGCNNCHQGFRKYTVENGFHGGNRVNGNLCGICHNIARLSGRDDAGIPAADSGRFVHRIHYSENLTLASSIFDEVEGVTYPQDIRNCQACHAGAAQGDQWKTRPNRSACGSCHDYVSFVSTTGTFCNATADKSAGCKHSGGPQPDDGACLTCHGPGGMGGGVAEIHVPVEAKDPNNSLDGGTNVRTNAAQIAAADAVPVLASKLEYVVSSVAKDSNGHPTVTFKLTRDGNDVVFNTYAPGTVTEPITDFVGTAGIYFAWATPQDGIATPADFNNTKGASLRELWNGGAVTGGTQTTGTTFSGTACTAGAPCTCTPADPCLPATSPGTLTGPVSGYYTATLTATTLPANATMLTGGLGYQYDLATPAQFANGIIKNQPLTQVDNSVDTATSNAFKLAYPYDATKGSGGLIVPIRNQPKTATGFTARRAVVDNAKCNACHTFLGVAPSFHVGQRNNGTTCSFCHNPNKANSAGWAANVSTFVHAIHAAEKRTVPFGWESSCPTGSTYSSASNACLDDVSGAVVTPDSFADVKFPGYLANCQGCHLPGTYDFSAAGSAAAVPNLLWSTAAAGTVTTGISTSPYVQAGATYGSGTDANTLVESPIMAVCVSCHDSASARGHMQGQGGAFYETRASVTEASGRFAPEGCLLCHGPGGEWSIASMHR